MVGAAGEPNIDCEVHSVNTIMCMTMNSTVSPTVISTVSSKVSLTVNMVAQSGRLVVLVTLLDAY